MIEIVLECEDGGVAIDILTELRHLTAMQFCVTRIYEGNNALLFKNGQLIYIFPPPPPEKA